MKNKTSLMRNRTFLLCIGIALPFVVIASMILFLKLTYSGLTIQNFEGVEEDYQTAANLITKYYAENYTNNERLHLDRVNDSLFDNKTGKALPISDNEKQSLNAACTVTWNGNHQFQYDFIEVTQKDMVFWEDETFMYGILYTKNISVSKKELRSRYYDTMEFHKIQKNWYEIGSFGI